MKMNGTQELLGNIARRSLVLVGLLAMALICATSGRAQSSATTASTQDVKPTAAPAAPAQKPAAIANLVSAQAKPVSPEEKPPAKGAKEGIVVHGHWTIEVKNPDGTVAARQEFENALDPNEGADLLTGLLAGTYTTDGFLVSLYSGNSICGGICEIFDSRVASACSQFGYQTCGTLTYTAKSASTNAVGFTLSGSVILLATDGGTISAVSAGILGCVPGSNLSGLNKEFSDGESFFTNATLSSSFGTYPPGQYLSGAACRNAGSATPPFTSVKLLLTSRTISQPVAGGQSVAVTVVITFS
jgi:hypothetical protein